MSLSLLTTSRLRLKCLTDVVSSVLLVGLINSWSFIPAVVVLLVMLFLRHRFARCLRDLKRIEGTTRSPVFSQLSSTINGLKVIRSYHAEHMCSEEFLHHLDDNFRAHYFLQKINTWAAFRFNFVALLFAAVTTSLAILARTGGQKFSASDIALTLSYSLNLMGLLQWTVR